MLIENSARRHTVGRVAVISSNVFTTITENDPLVFVVRLRDAGARALAFQVSAAFKSEC